ncbi:MAG: hypothetical protein Q7S19_00370 [bacterium]|nr:hypothetical protein [bacterium]
MIETQKELIVLLAVLIVVFGSLAMTLHKINFKPIIFEILSWAVTGALFLYFEIVLHWKN